MKQLLIASVLILMAMSGIAAADQEKWVYGRSNTVMEGIEAVMYDFEEGINCQIPFDNQHPDVATFLDVPPTSRTPIGYGPDHPSYVRIGGSSCGTGLRCYMNIYPVDRGHDWIYIVNGNSAFSPVTCCMDSDLCSWVGSCCPGVNSEIEFKEDTTYISFLASTGPKLSVRLYDRKGNWLYSETIDRTIDRVGSEPSNFTRFEVHLPDKEIGSMKMSGAFNGWHIDDLFVGGAPGYLNKPVDCTYVSRRAQELHGVDYLPYGLGHDYVILDYMDPWQFTDGMMGEYWHPESKTFEEGEGISNAGLVLWAYNQDSMELAGQHFVKQCTVAKMEKHDFTVEVDPASTQPGDVCFKDRDYDGYADEVYMVTEEHDGGFDLITACPDSGVINSKSSIVEDSPAFMGYKRLPGVIRGGKNPIPKGH